jgi:signal transduction histidine kinase
LVQPRAPSPARREAKTPVNDDLFHQYPGRAATAPFKTVCAIIQGTTAHLRLRNTVWVLRHRTRVTGMTGKVNFLMTFRARLMMLLTAFLVLTITLVLVLDKWAQKRGAEEVALQSEKVKSEFNQSFGDFAKAVSLAVKNLSTKTYLFDQLSAGEIELPLRVQHIIVADSRGLVIDSDVKDLVNQSFYVPAQPEGEADREDIGPIPMEGQVDLPGGRTRTYNIPTETDKGLHWIVIVMQQRAIINQIDNSQTELSNKNRELSDYKLWSTTGLLFLALAFAVVIGWRFTRPIKQLASAARRVAAGSLNFRVKVKRADEVGQLASTFNEMIEGLKAKRELEEKLNHSERSAVIGRLTASVAHEIRNPLNVLNLSIDHVSSKFAPDDLNDRMQFTRILSSMKDEIARLKHLVSDLLNYGRPAQLAVRKLDLRQLVEETIALIRPQAEAQNVTLTVEEGESSADVRGDRERLKSCLSNLTINALQAMPSGGHLVARVRRQDGFVEVTVRDNGVGISEEALTKIFEPYFSTKQSGFGLGLAVTKKIVEEHQGLIEVSSEVNHGTTFKLKIPAAEAE